MLVKDLIKNLKQLKPDDEIWATYITKDDIAEKFNDIEPTDENGNFIDTNKYVTNEVLLEICSDVDSDEYLWERFSESFGESCSEVLYKKINQTKEAEQDTDLWDTDENLWDTDENNA